MSLTTWCYVSDSRLPAEDEAVVIGDIVSISRVKNAGFKVSGALIFARARFAQYIEGPEQAITILRQAIETDPRHGNVRTLYEGLSSDRRFAAWSLAYAGPASFVSRAMERPLIEALHGSEESVNGLIKLMSGLARSSPE